MRRGLVFDSFSSRERDIAVLSGIEDGGFHDEAPFERLRVERTRSGTRLAWFRSTRERTSRGCTCP